MRSGPGQTSAGAARCTRCDRRGSARSSAVDSTFRGRVPADAQAAGSSAKPLRGITSIPARMSSATGTWKGVPTGQARAVDEQRHNEPKPVVPPPRRGQATTEIPDRRGAFLATTDPRSDSVHALVAARLARSHATKSARLAALCGVVKVLQSPQIRRGSRRRRWPGHGNRRGSSCRGARCPFDHRTWRATEALRYASTGLSRPRAACGLA